MIYIRPASISWTHCIQSVSCSFGLWQGSARTSHFCGASLHEISGRFQVVSGCFTRQRAWERSFPTKAPLAQSDPQLQDGLKARMQTWDMTPKKLVPKMVSWCHVLFWEFCPSALQCHIVQPKKVTGLTREAACLSVSHWRLLRATCAGEWDHRFRFRFRFRDHQKKQNEVFEWFVLCLWNLLHHVIVALIFTDWLPSQPGRRVLWWGRTTTCRLPSQKAKWWPPDLSHFLWKATCQGATRGHWSTLRSQARHVETCRDMPMSCDPYVLTSVVFVFHAYVSQVNVLGLGYTTHPVLEGNNLKTEEGQSEGQRPQHATTIPTRVTSQSSCHLVACDILWNDSPRQNKDITTWPQQNLEGRAWIGGSMLSRKLMEIME